MWSTMPWEKNFDIDETLTRAMQTFWAHGYEATSMQDLVTATGVNRASIYATYGDKRALFLTALRKYDGEIRRRMLAELAETKTPAEAIAAVFDKFIGQTTVPQGNWGCFLVNTALELAAHDDEISELVNAAQDEIEAFFLAMIRKGQQSGAFAADRDAKPLAHQALASLLGMLVMIRSRPEEEFLTAVRDGFLKSLT
ncbi:TetR/AcrR family transcriptional regulator [Rhizorhabdus dicambivorans]|uniref:TetR/AcrR family transcriptional regulator n=2 Tax=Rhizorhabdus dicambivorans TaxID=1850238 RepID=A0A2A4FT02_9SPHN|nr:TetR/AcrR family transcriptional regulator [Rhizorhabdus dicambivorans]PCE40824.1 TetR/AcrR family transcriptional regulator [Rhizorhabdus dicambivorans]